MSRRGRGIATLDAIAARLYAAGYDGVVSGFRPYERLVDEIAGFVARDMGCGPAHVLDVACGTGSVARRLARRGHVVMGVDVVPRLVETARRRTPPALAGQLLFSTRDIALDGPPAVASFDAVVMLHTLYWHPEPERLLSACRAALRPGGHAIVVAYRRAAAVRPTLAAVRRVEGIVAAAGALRWLVPTAAFEALRRIPRRYVDEPGIRRLLTAAGFDVRESRSTFLGDVSVIAWARREARSSAADAVGALSDDLQPSGLGRP